MKAIPVTIGIACCALILLGSRAIVPLAAQEPTSDRELIERLRQIQDQLKGGQSPAEPSRRADEMTGEIEAIEQGSRSEASGQGPMLSEEEVRQLVHEGLGVDVLAAETVERDGRRVYALTVMSPPGNDNAAFMVRTLLVDGATGGLLGEVPHTPRTGGADLSPGAPAADPDSRGLEIRRRTYR